MAYLNLMKEREYEAWKFESLLWRISTAFGGTTKPPALPPLLRGE